MNAQFRIDILGVPAHCVGREVQLLADVGCGSTACKVRQYLPLAIGESLAFCDLLEVEVGRVVEGGVGSRGVLEGSCAFDQIVFFGEARRGQKGEREDPDGQSGHKDGGKR